MLLVVAALVVGMLIGRFAPRLLRKPPKQEDRSAGLRRYQDMKNG